MSYDHFYLQNSKKMNLNYDETHLQEFSNTYLNILTQFSCFIHSLKRIGFTKL